VSGDEEDKGLLERKKKYACGGITAKREKIREKRSVEDLRKLIN